MNSDKTLFEIRKKGEEILEKANISDPSFDATALLLHCFRIDRTEYARRLRQSVPGKDPSYQEYRNAVARRAEHVPLQYITGCADFMGHTFIVTPDVLIPRFDSETLVAAAAKEAKSGMRVLDLCTGSGCLLLSLMKEVPGLSGTGCDLSALALRTAEKNAEQLHVSPVDWCCGDLFRALPENAGPFDMIITNPPYIETEVIGTLDEEVRSHEPLMALDGGTDGLAFYRRILEDAGRWLVRGGSLFAETGFEQTEKVKELFERAGFTETTVLFDLGGNARVVRGKNGNTQ